MFDKDFFQTEQRAGPSRSGRVVGGVGMWGLHLAAVAFAIYSGYHGINATTVYRAESGLGMAAGVIGIVVIELVLMSLYLAWHNGQITGAAQSIATGVTASAGFTLACFGIVADSQLQAGIPVSPWLSAYLTWGLPIAPAFMALGALLTHELAPTQLRARRESNERDELDEVRFSAQMASLKAELKATQTVVNMQLNARTAAARQIAAWFGTEEAQQAITQSALRSAPAVLRSIGIDTMEASLDDANGEVDIEDLVAYMVEERLRQRQMSPETAAAYADAVSNRQLASPNGEPGNS